MSLPYFLGCPQWQDPHWNTQLPPGSSALSRYARAFNCVEGNTTFYATPSASQCEQWRTQVPDDFRFLFKLPRLITHDQHLSGAEAETRAFVELLKPLDDVLGPILLQLPASFGPRQLGQLWRFLDSAPAHLNWSVEVRHPAFFSKGDEERALNRELRARSLARVCLDSRGLFAAIPDTEEILDAQRKKPRVPVHILPTDAPPVIRYIGHPNLDENDRFLQPWVERVAAWVRGGIQPYVFMHMPDNRYAVALASRWTELLQAHLPELPPLPVDIATPQLGLF
ncbi:DUF72 domain-containing protein [Marinobacter daepoensis]|uniref:DUF72 domain-containing protein n=1 Tax=Marinobacter daepoensis TaxID=262077 RepID=UPI001C94E6BE|nr:DUF72 domain-containing protein [Marinobacter daepoensis]MBY6033358.1 DUF72 domain-containing protein [Marinobacter daepoensis]